MMKFFKKHKYTIIFAILILAVSLGARLYRLTSLPIFADEAIYVRWAQVMRAEETLRFLPLSDGKQPLFMWSVIPFLKIFSDPLLAGRFLSVLAGLGTIIGVFLTAKLLFKSEKIALVAALIMGISPFALFFDRMALVDPMLTMFAIWTFYFTALTARTLRMDFAMIAGFALGGAFLTKSPAIFFLILIPTGIFLVDFSNSRRKKIFPFGRFLLLVLVTWAIGYGLNNILRLGPNFHLLSSRNLDYVYPYSHILTSPLNPLLPHLKATLEYFWLMGPATLLILTVLGIFFCFKKDWKVAIVLGAWSLFPLLAVTEYGKVFTARYILFILPFIALFSAASFLSAGGVKKAVTAALIVFVLHSFYVDALILTDVQKATLPRSERSGYLEEWTAGYGIKEVSDAIRQQYQASPEEKIVVGTEGYFGTLPDGVQIYLNDLPQITVVGVGLGIDRVPQPLFESKKAGNKTYLVVNSNRLLADADKVGLELLAAYPKAVKPNGSRDSLLFFEVTKDALGLSK